MVFLWLWFVVQIVLESFPVSSSGHIQLCELVLYKFGTAWQSYQHFFLTHSVFDHISINVMDHFAHGATVCVVALFFFNRCFFLLRNIFRCWPIVVKIIGLTFVADCVTFLFFIFFNVVGVSFFFLGLGFFITMVALYSLRWVPEQTPKRWCLRSAIILGCVQGIALLPGISRLGLTYVVGRWLGFAPRKAFEISLLIQWPLIAAAFLNSVRILFMHNNLAVVMNWQLLSVMLGAGVLAFYGLCFVAWCADQKKMWLFSWYMMVPLCVWLLLQI